MGDRLKAVWAVLRSPRLLKALISFRYSGYLLDVGWFEAFRRGMPVRADGAPIPWTTYPFIEFVEPRLRTTMRLFEYGCGNSTLFWADRVALVHAVEHDAAWAARIGGRLPPSARVVHAPQGSAAYAGAVMAEAPWDIVIVDGVDRNACLERAVEALSPHGVIVLDDSERPEYAVDHLLRRGFRRLDLWGISPGYWYRKCTTLFYRDGNILGI